MRKSACGRKRPSGVERPLQRQSDGAGNVTRHRVDGLAFAAEALGGVDVDDPAAQFGPEQRLRGNDT